MSRQILIALYAVTTWFLLACTAAKVHSVPTAPQKNDGSNIGKKNQEDIIPLQTGFFIESKPNGSSILIDGNYVGKTPGTVTHVKPGKHTIQLSKNDYYEDLSFEILIEDQKINVLPKKHLKRIKADVEIDTCPPGGNVMLVEDDKQTALGRAPVEVTVDIDKEYKFQLSKTDYKTQYVVIKTTELFQSALFDRYRSVIYDLTKQTSIADTNQNNNESYGNLTVQTSPWSKAYVNNEFISNTPVIGLPLPTGTHQITVENPKERIKKQYAVNIRPCRRTLIVKDIRD